MHIYLSFGVFSLKSTKPLAVVLRTGVHKTCALAAHTRWVIYLVLRSSQMTQFLKLEDEKTVNPKMLISHDGNNSSKHIAGAGSAEESRFCSTYFISREQVDLFKDKVQHR
jgi:hypothetical protein